MTFKDALELNADYMDADFNIYHIQAYLRTKKFGLPTVGIEVTNNGKKIGIVEESEIQKILAGG